MGLMLHRKDGTVAVKCGQCGRLCDIPLSSSGDAVCGKCVSVVVSPKFTGKVLTARDLPKFGGLGK